jgi:NAD/NADP transhydrogenase alpha subunit
LVAVTCATINVVGGFLITDRMLRMFKKKEPGPNPQGLPGKGGEGKGP